MTKNLFSFAPQVRMTLLLLAVLGFTIPNGVFLWFAFARPAEFFVTMRDPLALVFIVEAFVIMFLLAWLVRRSGRGPGALAFIMMSLVGSLAFSVPAWIWLASREESS